MLYNNIVTDSFFVKAYMVNNELAKSDNIYGNNAIGNSFRFVVTDMGDQKFVGVGSQAFQSGYSSLQLPYSYNGIGRSNNYVETFYTATSVNAELAQRMWTPIIPNSQLIVFGESAQVDDWGLELFVNPTNSLYIIVISCGVCLFVIGIIIIVLHCKEKAEDKKNRDENFDYF